MTKMLHPFLGVLCFLGAALSAAAFDVPREALIEIVRPVDLNADATGTRTGLPDLDALVGQYKGALTQYAMPASVKRHAGMKRYLLIRLDQLHEREMPSFLQKLSRLASVRWAEPNRAMRSRFQPNDPQFYQQWGLVKVHAEAAWDVTRGSSSIPLAIIDTGCDMTHPDLVPSFWTNSDEIPNNGLDDDDNGFIDDIHGWDFVDAPSFPSGGDYLVRDNDPSDEMGHGTAVAGICGAGLNNGLGVAGLAPDCPLMILRAGNMDGFLQEDDVASAILYALDNDARVVNMSFGDTQASPMLGDVITYAAQGGLLMIAASGNDGINNIIYPAAYSSVLCVGATDPNGNRASFSNYGTALDLLAPGQDIVSTLMNGAYGMFSTGDGTSFSTAFASAAAGLVLSRHGGWDPPMVMSVLKSSCDDMGPTGWDPQTGQGSLRADKAVQVNDALTAQISYPAMGQGFAQTYTLNVGGTAAGVYLQGWSVYVGIGENPFAWDTLYVSGANQVVNGTLAIWRNSQPLDTAYTLRLIAADIFGHQVDDRVVIYYDPSPPNISDISMVPIYDGDRPSYLLRFHTDDLTTGKLWLFGGLVARWISLSLNYQTQDHVLLVGGELSPDDYDYRLTVVNTAGDTTGTGVLGTIDLRETSIATNNFVQLLPCNLPPSYMYETATDLDNDGLLEIWLDSLNDNLGKDSLYVWESATGATFTKLDLNFRLQIPKSIWDSDADGKQELLTLYGGTSKIFEATTPGGLPQPGNVVWSQSNDTWGIKLMDLVPNDGRGEVLLDHDGQYQLWANNGTSTLQWYQNLPNPFPGTQTIQQLYCQLDDFDGDGLKDLLFGDLNGHLFIYEQQAANSEYFQTTPVWSITTGLLDVGVFLVSGDWDGDGHVDFGCLAHTETVLPGEHLADTRYWALFTFRSTGNNQYAPMDVKYFFGARNPDDFASGMVSGDVYGDSRPELILCLYPNLYVLGWNASEQGFAPLWYHPQCRSNKAVVGDFNRNGQPEFLFNDGLHSRVFEAVGSWSQSPPPPLNFQVRLMSTTPPQPVILTWSPVSGAEGYKIYRGSSPVTLDSLSWTNSTTFTNFYLSMNTTYYYAVSTVDSQLVTFEGPPTVPLAATPNDTPLIVGDSAHFVWPNFVTLDFSEPMDNSILDPNNYYVFTPGAQLVQPRSIVSDRGGKRSVLTFDPVLQAVGQYRMIIDTLYDLQGSALVRRPPNDTLRFAVYIQTPPAPYLVSAGVNNDRSVVTLTLSQRMEDSELGVLTNYLISADVASGLPAPEVVKIKSITYHLGSGDLQHIVDLAIDSGTPLNSLLYRVEARNLHGSSTGISIDTTHNSAVLSFSENSLARVYAYPNPCSPSNDYIVFNRLTAQGEIRILTIAGEVIRKIPIVNGVAHWDLRNDRGQKVGSGIYLYAASNGSERIWRKLAVVR